MYSSRNFWCMCLSEGGRNYLKYICFRSRKKFLCLVEVLGIDTLKYEHILGIIPGGSVHELERRTSRLSGMVMLDLGDIFDLGETHQKNEWYIDVNIIIQLTKRITGYIKSIWSTKIVWSLKISRLRICGKRAEPLLFSADT